MTETRKLAAILAADVVGYSRLAAADEERILARLRALRSDLIDPTIAVHHGRVVKRTGDGALVEFRSVVDAVRCAIEVQNGMVERNAGLPPDRRIEFRIGVHLGDVVEEADGDLMGDGINIAARLENICEPGAICLSEPAYWQVKSRLDLAVADLGDKSLKNIPEPVHVFSLEVGKPALAKPAAAPVPPKNHRAFVPILAGIAALIVIAAIGALYFIGRGPILAANAPAHLSIVVLPFENLSGDPKQDYFADGITENLTTDLSRIRNSFVIARNTAFTYKGKNVDAKEIGNELGVRYVLEGSVQRDGNRVRVNAQLIDAENGSHLWANRFEEDLTDLFKLQDDIVARLANALGYELVNAEATRSAHTSKPDAIDLTMQGLALLNKHSNEKSPWLEARRKLDQALQLDPENADALGGLAYLELVDFSYGWGASNTDYEAALVATADKAITLNRGNALPYSAKAVYLFLTKRANEALVTAQAGLAANQNSADLYFARSGAENSLGQFDEAKSDIERAIRLSPHDPGMGRWLMSFGQTEMGLGNYAAAIDEEHRAIEIGYHNFIPYANLASAYALAGNQTEAQSAWAEARRLNPKLTAKWWMAHGPSIPILFEGLRKAGLPEDEPPKHLSIIVLPFTNLSGDPKQDYFADGITENLTTDLSRIRSSFVIARNTAFTYKGKNVDAKAIGKELGVRYVLEGSVQRDGNRVRVNAQLIDAESGAHLWANRFEEDLADLFKLQDDVVARLANALGYELVKAEAARSARSTSPDALDLTMQGWAIANRWDTARDRNSVTLARDFFEKALKIDPANAEAKVGLAQTDYYRAAYVQMDREAEFTAEAERALTEALTLDPDNARAYVVRQLFYTFTRRSAEAKAAARKAISINPSYAVAYAGLAQAEHEPEEFVDAMANIDTAMKLSPRDPGIGRWHWTKGKTFNFMRRFPDAIRELHAAIDNGFSGWPVYMHLAVAYALDGQQANAQAAVEETLRTNPKMTVKWARDHVDDPDVIWEGLRKAGLPEDEGPRLSIVVLPFQNLSGDTKQDYLADVLTDELTTYISRIPGSFVIARNTAFTYKGKPTDVKQIGKDLGVRYALEGSVQPTDKRIRTNAQLIDTETGAHLWAEEFDNDKTDLLQTEDEIVTRLARSLDVALTEVEAAKGARIRSDNPDAQDLALRCSATVNDSLGVRDPAKLAVIYNPCEQALRLDPRNVLALGLLGWRRAFAVSRGASADVATDIRHADEFISRGLAVDPNDSGVHTAKGLLLTIQGHMDELIVEYERSIALNPTNMNARAGLCGAYNGFGQPAKALQCTDTAIRLSPRDPIRYLFYFHKMWALFALQRDSEALEWANRTLALAPGSTLTLRYAIAELSRAGKDVEARQAYQRLVSLPGNPIKNIAQLKTYDEQTWPAADSASAAARERLYAGLRKAGMPEK